MKCPCGSSNEASLCCIPYTGILNIDPQSLDARNVLADWLDKYSGAIADTFRTKASPFIFRISCFLDATADEYAAFGSTDADPGKRAIGNITNNIMLSFFGATSCMTQGLLLQSGAVLRSLVEDCLVLLDIAELPAQMEKLVRGKYSVSAVVTRVKPFLPPEFLGFYGHFSNNFAHCGPLHTAPYVPRKCWPDNWVLVVGLENLIRAALLTRAVLERVYFDLTDRPWCWRREGVGGGLEFDKDGPAYTWAARLVAEIQQAFPVSERKPGFTYDPQDYRLK